MTKSSAERKQGREPRLSVLKTYKLYIGGKFPRTESGRFDRVLNAEGEAIANICRSSRKDFREAVVAARNAQDSWAARSAYNRGQILYRIGEMLEGRRGQFESELEREGMTAAEAETEVSTAIDRWIYYAGWTDKVQQIFSSVNPVSSSHFNFSLLEPTGVVSILAPENSGVCGLASVIAPVIAAGNTCVVLVSSHGLSAISFAEVLHSSDVPAGVVNVLTGQRQELLQQFASHLDVNAVVYTGESAEEIEKVQREAVHNLKRVAIRHRDDWPAADEQGPYSILDTCEIKTTWHPIGG